MMHQSITLPTDLKGLQLWQHEHLSQRHTHHVMCIRVDAKCFTHDLAQINTVLDSPVSDGEALDRESLQPFGSISEYVDLKQSRRLGSAERGEVGVIIHGQDFEAGPFQRECGQGLTANLDAEVLEIDEVCNVCGGVTLTCTLTCTAACTAKGQNHNGVQGCNSELDRWPLANGLGAVGIQGQGGGNIGHRFKDGSTRGLLGVRKCLQDPHQAAPGHDTVHTLKKPSLAAMTHRSPEAQMECLKKPCSIPQLRCMDIKHVVMDLAIICIVLIPHEPSETLQSAATFGSFLGWLQPWTITCKRPGKGAIWARKLRGCSNGGET